VKLHPVDQRTLSVFIVHFKSKRTVDDDDPQSAKWRLAEALAVRRIVEQRLAEDPDAWIAVVGDFNDTPESRPIKALTEPVDDRGVLVDLIGRETDTPPVTYLRSPYRSQIDYIMVTPGLAACYVAGSARVINQPNMMQASDHTPIVASFDLPVAAPSLP
jgi:endonuclease/exonuclease/phosphatase family metal-dependent hydrolase